jgi:hypothetical protein
VWVLDYELGQLVVHILIARARNIVRHTVLPRTSYRRPRDPRTKKPRPTVAGPRQCHRPNYPIFRLLPCQCWRHARMIQTSTFDIVQGHPLEYSSQPRHILRGYGVGFPRSIWRGSRVVLVVDEDYNHSTLAPNPLKEGVRCHL